jgi:antitoxin (DNA-binding transcriptional repressor) of toxin-antitoxin stability system
MLKAKLSAYLRAVDAGSTLLVTDRGRPVAELRPPPSGSGDPGEALLAMEARGEVTLGRRRLRAFRAARMRGGTASSTVIEDREDRA